MKTLKSTLFILFATISWANAQGEYTLHVEGFDWGPAVNKVTLPFEKPVSTAQAAEFTVFAHRKNAQGEIPQDQSYGKREVTFAYISDEKGNRLASGNHITLVLSVGPMLPVGSPIQYIRINNQGRNLWIDYQLTIFHNKSNLIWQKEAKRIMPQLDLFNLKGQFKYNEQLTMSYASYEPRNKTEKSPLIIWLHGGGEGGFDPTIPLIGNKAVNYASTEIQSIFEGAYVLSPQCPGAWMHNSKMEMTGGRENDIYNEGLMALIKNYVQTNPGIDPNRLYVGGCSNGGYMALKLILNQPDYFAAGYISALAYQSQYITDQEIKSIKHVPIWFVHSKDDSVTVAEKTVVPVYTRLKAAGAKNVYFTFYDHVNDITSFYGGEGFRYNGHWSWIYLHENKCRNDYDGSLVKVGGRPVNIMEWLALQKLALRK
ncbi:MAG: prolyl oligopeptidase family serine peptidase [Saprospiraceae bacterium]|nr:prolyl oligopeptidase family serine peptidase [Saprospiraceae bacterium]MDP5090049.1 prolyl oligopeptidase family serine peptidase [Saprospiraceae bacterium]